MSVESQPKLIVADSKAHVSKHLNSAIVDCCVGALKERGVFTIALSGGSLPSMLSTLKEAFDGKGADPQFQNWNVILADERCVPVTDDDSNMKALNENLFSKVPIPPSHIYGINEKKLHESPAAVASDYEEVVRNVLRKSGGQLDLAVLGFGPDGHTCSLFPNHPILLATGIVASITDSPKPPPNRISLTLPFLNTMTRNIIFCGAGKSKSPILQAAFSSILKVLDVPGGNVYSVKMTQPPPYPCVMVAPNSPSLTWVVDSEATEGVPIP